MKMKNRIGIRYGNLIVLKFVETNYNYQTFWLCKCNCGKEVIIRGSDLQTGNTKSCGCLKLKLLSERTGLNHPTYKGGNRTNKILKLKEKIRKRDNYTCQDCRMTQEECLIKWSRKLDVHHIDNDDTNNVEKNMISLCKGCHRKTKKCW